ncbi:MAG: hypothetical protein AAFV33_29300 [Chloroflexota bacterium]
MTEENQTPQPQWVADLKEWGIDVEVFNAKWEQSGDEAKAEFRQALMNAETEFNAGKSDMEAKVDEVRADVETVVKKMGTAWDEMVSTIKRELNPEAGKENGEAADKDA